MKLTAIIAVAAAAATSAAEAGNPSAVLVAQPVRAPVSAQQVSASEPFVPDTVPEVAGEITVGPDRGAALWLDPLDVIVVRHARGAKLQLSRIVGVAGTRASIAEPGSAASAELTYLTQSAGRGDVWLIAAAAPTKIVVERPILRSGRAAWEDTQRALLAWVDRGGTRPELPITDGSGALGARLDMEASIGAAIEKLAANDSVRSAVRAWRKAGVVGGATAIRPFVAPQLAMESLALRGMGDDVTVPDPEVAVPHPYRRVAGPRTLEVDLEGPGALRVELRGILPANGATLAMTAPPAVSLAVSSAGQRIAKRSLAAGYASAKGSVLPVAFPRKQPLISSEGAYLGERIAISIPLYPGKHRYAIAVEGGELALRATVARRRVRLGEALGGSDDADRFVSAARDALGDDASAAAQLVRRLIDQRAGVVVQRSAAPSQLPPLLRLAWSTATTQLDERAALAAARDAGSAKERTAAWTLVAQLATRARANESVAALVAALPGQPPPAIIPELVAALPTATAIERIRNWRQAALDLAWRSQPLDPALAFADHAAWRGGEWALIAPTPRDSDAEPAPPQRWLVETRGLGEQLRTWRAGDLWQLAVGRAQTVIAAPSTIDPARAALLDVFVAGPANRSVQIDIDGKRMQATTLAAVERFQIAVTPGRHRVRLAAPAGVRAWMSHTPAAAVRSEDTARIQYYWPVAGMRTVLPTEASSTPIQVALRALGTKPLRVTLRTDVGTPTELELVPGETDTTAHPLATASATGASISFAVRLPAGSRMVWFETAEPERLLAAVFVRRARADAMPEPASSRTTTQGDAIDRVTAASRELARDPNDARSRAERASELLDLGEPALAREDLLRLLRVPADRRAASAPIEDDLFARLEGFAEPTHIALVETPTTPVPIAPSSLVLEPDLVELYASARVDVARGDHPAAAGKLVRLYQRTGAWQLAFEAIDASAHTDASALTYGLASRLRGVLDHPRVRRALVVSAAQSGWSTLTSTSSNAGQETLFSSEPTLPPAPPVVIREALIAPPWPARNAHTLTANTTATLELDAPATTQLFAQVKCVAVKRQVATRPCMLTARIDQGAARAFTATRDATAELDVGTLTAGRHVVELAFATGSEGDIASARFATDRVIAGITAAGEDGRFPIEIERRGKVFVANPRSPISVSVLGKTTLWVQARAVAPGIAAARSVEIVATPAKGEPVRTTLALTQERSTARGDTGRDLVVSVPSDAFILLPDPGTYSITVTPDRGEIVARLARREDRSGKAPRVPAAWYADAPPTLAAFALPSPPAVAAFDAESFAEPTPRRSGTLSFELAAGQDSYTEEDLLPARARGRIDAIAGHRLALSNDRAWLTSRALVRAREQTNLVAGGASELYLAHLPLDLSAQVRGSALTQAFSLGRAWHVRGDARVTRPFAATSTLTLLPSVAYAHSWLNTTPQTVEVTTEEIDPEVFTKYRYAHDRTASARIALRWMPLQDFIGTLSIGGASNRDLRSFDHVDAAVRLQHLLALPLIGDTYLSAAYHPRYRLADADRMDSFVQHQVSTRVEWSMWTGTSGRFLFGVWNEVAVTPTATLPAFGASLRFELIGHRGLVDYAPDEAVFTSLLEHRSFARLEAP
jgi:hypothetical protein